MMKIELQEVDLRLPLVKINYEQIKEQLEGVLKDYTGLAVTEDTLPACKDAQKELARLRREIDAFRKDKKKELSVPIKAMEDQCKELIALVEKAEKPIKEGIMYFDDIRRKAKYEIAEKIIKEVAEQMELNEKYASKLDIKKEYTNLTAKEKDVRADIENRAFALMIEQKRENERRELLINTIESENERLHHKMELSDFALVLNSNLELAEMVAEVHKRAESLYKAEHTVEQEKVINVSKEESKTEYDDSEDVYEVALSIIGTANTIRTLAKFLKDNDIYYEKHYQRNTKKNLRGDYGV